MDNVTDSPNAVRSALETWEQTHFEPGVDGDGERDGGLCAEPKLRPNLFEDDDPSSCMGEIMGRFRLLRRIGSGAMGVVFEGYDRDLDRRVALKVLRPDVASRPNLQAHSRMMREAKALARLRHPNVTAIYEVGTTDDSVLFLAMELVEGRTLRRWLRSRPRSWREIVQVFVQAGRGLAAAHEAGLVHRDFKPDNVIIDDRDQPRVVDFGLARTAGLAELLPTLDEEEDDGAPVPVNLTCTGAVLGTPAYMAPEQFKGAPVQARSDQFSFCVALFEALYGRRPYPGDDLPTLQRSLLGGRPVGPRRGVPRSLYRVLRRGLSIEAEARFGDMYRLLDALESCLHGSRTRRIAPMAAGLLLAAAAGSMLPHGPTPSPTPAVSSAAHAPVACAPAQGGASAEASAPASVDALTSDPAVAYARPVHIGPYPRP